MNSNSKIEQAITSLEVAEMVEKNHKELLRDIRRYCKQLAESKIAPSDFFTENTYLDANNQSRPCYNVTKKGCEFIAHKLTGAKGTVFTAKYINRFHEMETVINKEIASQDKHTFRATSKTPVPLASNWYSQNEQRIWEACKTCDISKKELFHRILYYLGETYDLDAAKQIYKKERGYAPKYSMDIVGYFPELREMADEFIDRVLYSEFF